MSEQKMDKNIIRDKVLEYLNNMYKKVGTPEGYGFIMNNGYVVEITVCNDISFMLEYAGNVEEAEVNYFEDGERFHYEDFNTEKEVVDAVIKELQYYEVHG